MSNSASVATHLVLLRGGAAQEQDGSDADLARALISGDRAAPHRAWMRFRPAVRGNLRRIMGPGVDDEDLSQEVFLRFFQHVHVLREPAAVRGFLFAICLRVARRELRRRWLRRWLRLTDSGALPEARSSDVSDPAGDADDREARETVTRYYAILDAVGGQGRSLFVARYIEELELAEVARIHGLSVSTTQRRLARVAKRVEAMVRGDAMLKAIAGPAQLSEASQPSPQQPMKQQQQREPKGVSP